MNSNSKLIVETKNNTLRCKNGSTKTLAHFDDLQLFKERMDIETFFSTEKVILYQSNALFYSLFTVMNQYREKFNFSWQLTLNVHNTQPRQSDMYQLSTKRNHSNFLSCVAIGSLVIHSVCTTGHNINVKFESTHSYIKI